MDLDKILAVGNGRGENGLLEGIILASLIGGNGFLGNRGGAAADAVLTQDGFQNLTNAVNGVSASLGAYNNDLTTTLCQEFSGTNAAIANASMSGQLRTVESTGAITSAIKECCCNTQASVAASTQAILNQMCDDRTQGLRDSLCAANSEIGSLKSQKYTDAAIAAATAAQTAVILQHLQFTKDK